MAKQSDNGQVETPDAQSIEDMQDDQTFLGAALDGTEEQLSFDLSGCSGYELRDSTLKLGTIPTMTVHGQYQEGDRVKVVLEIEVEYIAFPPIKDRGFRVGTERRHHAQVMSASPLDG